MRFDINLVQKRKKNTTLALGKEHYLHCFGLLTCFSVWVSLWLSGICPLSLYVASLFISIFPRMLFCLWVFKGLNWLMFCMVWPEGFCWMCLLLLQTTFSRFVFGHLFFYCHVGYWFFSSGNINYVCFSSVTIALCLFYSPSVTIFLSILALLLQSQFV